MHFLITLLVKYLFITYGLKNKDPLIDGVALVLDFEASIVVSAFSVSQSKKHHDCLATKGRGKEVA